MLLPALLVLGASVARPSHPFAAAVPSQTGRPTAGTPPVKGMPEPNLEAPPGLSSEWLALLRSIRAAEPGKAARLATRLSKSQPAIYWDDSHVAAEFRDGFREARDYAFAQWTKMVPGFQPKLVTSKAGADLVFDFAPTLAHDAGATFFFSEASDEPRLETVIAVNRTGGRSTSVDVHNEVAYGLGAYLGVIPSFQFFGAMGRTDIRAKVVVEVTPAEATAARRAIEISDAIRGKLAAKEAIAGGNPDLWLERTETTLPEVEQGGDAGTTFQIANRGDGPLLLRISGDCACLSAAGPQRLGPGETGVVRARYETAVIGGPVAKTVLVYTNDPERPLVRVPIKLKVRPVVRLLRDGGLVQVVDGDDPFDGYLLVEGNRHLLVDKARVAASFPIESTFTAWSGEVTDPEMQEGARTEKGYRLRAVPKGVPFGRSIVSIEIPTDDEKVGIVRFNYTIQRGIVAQPSTVYFGDLGPETEPIKLELSRPKRPFKIVSITSPHPGVTAKAGATGAADRFEILVSIDERRVSGRLQTMLKIVTDDPAQPTIELPVLANID